MVKFTNSCQVMLVREDDLLRERYELLISIPDIAVPALVLYLFDPTLKVSGAAATRDVDELYQGAYKSMPNVTIVRVDGSRHFIMLDQPAKFDALAEAFLKY